MPVCEVDSFGLWEGDADADREEFELIDRLGDADVDFVANNVGEDENDILGVAVKENFVTAGDRVSVTSVDCVFELSGECDADPEELGDFVCTCDFDVEDDIEGDADEEGEADVERDDLRVAVTLFE